MSDAENAVRDERTEFEAYVASLGWRSLLERSDIYYVDARVQHTWNGWSARAALSHPAAEAPAAKVADALAELVEVDALERAAARLFATLNKPTTKDSDYEAYSDLTGEVARRRPLAWTAAREALAAHRKGSE